MSVYKERIYEGISYNPEKNYPYEVTVKLQSASITRGDIEKFLGSLGEKHTDWRCNTFLTVIDKFITVSGWKRPVYQNNAIARFKTKEMAMMFKLTWSE